jgi:glutamyl-tRNA reductase
MSVVVVGVQQPRTPIDLLERVAVGEEALGKVLASLRDHSNLSEVVVLSTCLRTELYAVVERFHEGVADLQEFLSELGGTTPEALAEHVNVLFDHDVTVHLFEVAAGLRSAVLGETEVLGQVRRAAERADADKASGPVLSGLFRRAVQAGRRVRSTTAIARGSISLPRVAVELAQSGTGGSLVDRRVVVVGAGEMAAGVLRALEGRDIDEIVVANRTATRARSLASTSGARAVALGSLDEALNDADVVFVSTGASEHIVDVHLLESAGFGTRTTARTGSDRTRHGLLIVDMGMPRNVDPAVASLEGVSLLDIEDLNAHAELSLVERHEEMSEAREIVMQEVERYRADERARGAAPVVSALRERLDEIVQGELLRNRSRLSGLDEEERQKVESVVRDVTAKLAHRPTVALKEAAGTPRGERLVEALRTLFDL